MHSDSTSFYQMTFGRVLESFGLKKGDDSGDIHYRERPPLVLPSSRDLPPPEKSEATLSPDLAEGSGRQAPQADRGAGKEPQ